MKEVLRLPFFWISLLYVVLAGGDFCLLLHAVQSGVFDLLTMLYLPCVLVTYNRYFPRKSMQ